MERYPKAVETVAKAVEMIILSGGNMCFGEIKIDSPGIGVTISGRRKRHEKEGKGFTF